MKNKILAACNDPGGTMAVIPVIKRLLEQRSLDTVVFGGAYADALLKKENIRCRRLPRAAIGTRTLSLVDNILDRERPDIVFTSTSFGKVVDNALLYAAIRKGIPTFALIDQWCNYSGRFRVFSRKRTLPDYIGIMDSIARDEMLREGFPREKLIVTGQPYFDSLAREKSLFNKERRLEFRKHYGINKNDILVIFAAEPFKKGDFKIIGYTDIQILQKLIHALEETTTGTNRNIKLIIKLHPRDKRPLSVFPSHISPRVSVIAAQTGQARDFILNADIVTGMASIFLIESFLLRKPTLSIQIGLKSTDALITNKIGLTRAIRSYTELTEELTGILKGRPARQSRNTMKIDGKAAERVTAFLILMLRSRKDIYEK